MNLPLTITWALVRSSWPSELLATQVYWPPSEGRNEASRRNEYSASVSIESRSCVLPALPVACISDLPDLSQLNLSGAFADEALADEQLNTNVEPS